MCSNCLNLSGNGWVPFFAIRQQKEKEKEKKRETAMCSTFLFCFSLSNSVQHKDWRKSLSGSMFILEEQAFEDDRWPQVDNDDDLIRSLSLVWSRPKLLHPTDGINLVTVKKSRAIFCSFLPPLPPPHNFSFLSSKYHLQSETEIRLFPSDTAPQVVCAPSSLKLAYPSCARASMPYNYQHVAHWNINIMLK